MLEEGIKQATIEKMSPKSIRKDLEERYKCKLKEHKSFIKQVITAFMNEQQGAEEEEEEEQEEQVEKEKQTKLKKERKKMKKSKKAKDEAPKKARGGFQKPLQLSQEVC